MERGRNAWILAGLIAVAAASSAPAAEIQHDGVDCVVADRFPRFSAKLSPEDEVARARVSFRPASGAHWYSVPMKREGEQFVAVLPKPRGSLSRFLYYVEVTDLAAQTSRTAEFTALVAKGPAACQDRKVATSMTSATVTLEAPAGAPSVPAGFSGQGIAAAGAGVAAAAAGASVAGGGVPAAVLVGGGVVAAGAAAAVVVTQSGGSDGGDDPACCSPQASPYYSLEFGSGTNGMNVSVCAGSSLYWSGQAVPGNNGSIAADGSFQAIWSPGQPNTMRVVGRVTPTTFTATLSCVTGSGSGSLDASGSGGTYQGDWTFAGQRGALTVTTRTSP